MNTRPKVLYLKRINESGPPCDCVSETYSEGASQYVSMAVVRKILADIKFEMVQIDLQLSGGSVINEITTRLNKEML